MRSPGVATAGSSRMITGAQHSWAAAGTAAIQKLFAACAADAACSEVFPDPAAELEAARANASSRAPEHGEIFMEHLRTRLYSAPGARGALGAIRRAAGGDFSDFDASPQGPERSFADGLYLSIVCAESLPHFDLEEARVSARATAFGDYRLRRQSEACAHWPVPARMPPAPDRSSRRRRDRVGWISRGVAGR